MRTENKPPAAGRDFTGWGLAPALLLAAAALAGSAWQGGFRLPVSAGASPFPPGAAPAAVWHEPLADVLKLVTGLLIGLVISSVHQRVQHGKDLSRSMQQAQVLLCVAGALMMVIIGDSLPRAFGIAGAVSIVRFRTPVADPKDSIILLLALGLGMAAGLGAFSLAGFGTFFLCGIMLGLERIRHVNIRTMHLMVKAQGEAVPSRRIQEVLDRFNLAWETREMAQGREAALRYTVRLSETVSLERLSEELRQAGGEGVTSVVWERAKKFKG